MSLDLVSTHCAICETPGNADTLYPANFDAASLNPDIFSARRLPDLLHYQIVRCRRCGLVRSDPAADPRLLTELYRESHFTYGADTPNLAKTYGAYLKRTERYGVAKDHLLEIGCGDGFFLQEALRQVYAQVSGVEPGQDAVQRADPLIRPRIRLGMMRPDLFPPDTFSAICLFQTLDHIPNPNELLAECYKVLQPGGIMLCLNHNIDALSARLLKEKSPIIDIEHTYLYNPQTMRQLFEKHHFQIREVAPAWNLIRFHSLLRLMPLQKNVKHKVLSHLENDTVGKLSLWLPLGNLYIIAQKA
jgi:SAM-dependent methyltransferase